MASFHFDANELVDGLTKLSPRFSAAVEAYAETSAARLQSMAQMEAPWTDRTGHARQRLKGTSQAVDEGYLLSLAHGVDYGIWLEIAHECRFAIIDPTIKLEGPRIIEGLDHLLERTK